MTGKSLIALISDRAGAAAVEMALIAPLMLILMFGSLEIGNYFWNEHTLVKSVRDGARFAARQSFANYTACSGDPGGTVVADTKNVVMNGYLTGGSLLTPNIESDDIDVETGCATTAAGQTMSGIYKGRTAGAQIVTVTASVSYRSILGSLGFSGIGYSLNASSQAAVTGL